VVFALGLICVGFLLSFLMTQWWHLLLLWGVFIGFGTGMTALVLGATVATRWFNKRRGLVVGLMTASTATGQMIFQPLLATLTEFSGWRVAMFSVVLLMLPIMVLVLLLMRDYPAQLQLPVYGDEQLTPVPVQERHFGAMLLAPLRNLGEVSRTPTFWVLFLSFYVCGFSTNGLIHTHWVPMNL